MDVGDRNLKVIRLLGEGGFGRVFLCRNKVDGGNVCVKRIIVKNPKNQMKMIQDEIYIISQLKHPNIVRFMRSFTHGSTVNLVMEYMPNGTMKDVIEHVYRRSQHQMSEGEVLAYFCDILMGLEYLHIRRVIHRDLKPENLLVDGRGRIKISDFGISSVHNPAKQRYDDSGTPHFMAPEVLCGGRTDFKSDIWSLGCILHEMCLGQRAFQKAQTIEHLQHMMYKETRYGYDCRAIEGIYGASWAILIERMLRYDVVNRITLQEIIRFDPVITRKFYFQYFDYAY